ncbi:transcriptional regulator, LysR family [Cellulomonas flavigena DSM 20109]|uniref:Transcriptional regulator, LysR family n=1 Tax=Cellulomonas flavigena (strain ATCC 482 / DSM 20109 / BCRC 11376 / JCM 18109 / NBRC 3775 / NCIMB 8073 / NRS 134) TaxID=446466 RepID=D5UIF5_CELFN|nr:LysR substrate-binding domain-containing protein [Cellulomonas flavigena]ADG73454.1 transcriptional regulator, LysR family [Cellulomonas flavigena DSM 20109]
MRLLLVPGTSPDRWARVWRERLPHDPLEVVHADAAGAVDAVLRGDVDAAVLRLPPDGVERAAGLSATVPSTTTGWAVVPLWTERTVVVVRKDHVLTVVPEVDVPDLAGEALLVPGDDVLGWAPPGVEPLEVPDVPTAADLVAQGTGVLLVPHSLARLHDRRGTAVRVVPDAPGSPVVLVWRTDGEHPHVQELVGIVRGRTAGSSRGRGTPEAAPRATRAPRTPRPDGRRTPPRKRR